MDLISPQQHMRNAHRRQWFWLSIVLLAFYSWEFVENWVIPHFVLDQGPIEVAEWAIMPVVGLIISWLYLRITDRTFFIYEQQRAESEAAKRQVAQLEAVHATACTVAHEINQPLAIIKAYTQLLLEQPPADRPDADLQIILNAVNRAAGHIHKLQYITDYVTTPYAGNVLMLDISTPKNPSPDERHHEP